MNKLPHRKEVPHLQIVREVGYTRWDGHTDDSSSAYPMLQRIRDANDVDKRDQARDRRQVRDYASSHGVNLQECVVLLR
eukprot:1705346-Pyramimonas_sp.AAC.1